MFRLVLFSLIATFTLSSAFVVNQDSCKGRCDSRVKRGLSCQCNSHCLRFNDCCPDYQSECARDSCKGRCDSRVKRGLSCQCNSQCLRFNDCCPDYQSECARGGSTVAKGQPKSSDSSCMPFTQVTQRLWDSDVNRLSGNDVRVYYQAQVPDYSYEDKSTQRFFTSVDEIKLAGPTYQKFIALLDNYNPNKGRQESLTAQERQEEEEFLNAILQTSVMETLLDYLVCSGIVRNPQDFRATLKRLWFEHYPISGYGSIKDSSGFEHVLVGEYKDETTVNGFHNWLSFYLKEKAGTLDYYGYVSKRQPNLVSAAFNWNKHMKVKGSFFIGTSPEFDLALYSICFLKYPDQSCPVVLDGYKIYIVTHSRDDHVATAYTSF